ncbi:MAG: Sensor histidine kinase TmoS [Verrucomicrobiota bacterium]
MSCFHSEWHHPEISTPSEKSHRQFPESPRISQALGSDNRYHPTINKVPNAKQSKGLILLVDDDIDLRGILHGFLERSGFSVVLAGNGQEALEQAKNHRVDLLLTDLMMPEIPGIELIRTVRQNHLTLPIIAMSAGADLRNDRSLELATEAGAHVVLEKPFAMSRLIREVLSLLAAPKD